MKVDSPTMKATAANMVRMCTALKTSTTADPPTAYSKRFGVWLSIWGYA